MGLGHARWAGLAHRGVQTEMGAKGHESCGARGFAESWHADQLRWLGRRAPTYDQADALLVGDGESNIDALDSTTRVAEEVGFKFFCDDHFHREVEGNAAAASDTHLARAP